jgi:scavenger receptor class B protein 1
MSTKKEKSNRIQCILSGIGIVLIAFGFPFAIFWPQIFDSILIGEMHIGPNSKSFSEWRRPTLPLFMDIYFFNWTNPEEFTNHSTKPKLVELGPYRFREQREKVNISFHDENSTVSYRQISYFYFDAEGSKGSLDDEITTVNVVAAVIFEIRRN